MDRLREPVNATDIATRRLELLPLQVEFAGEMAAVLGDPALHAFIGGAPLSAGELRERYGRLVAGSPDPAVSWCNWVLRIRDEGCLAGTVQATVGTDGDGLEAEIAWVVGVSWQGRGLATEAARALVDWLGQWSVRTVVAHIHPDHAASAAVAAACGLAPTDRMHDGEVRWQRTLSRRTLT
ncbi:GNAT family N-acetyltransferase [Streptomyces sp. AcE210]|uniref:GNAT family N-acetyltransferase n=1 Tax=Streptomyces sp. AcE210 TaxID=2292703 RepID=UPI000E3001C1|nr:GNAT family N-acetyltransferase [Streptomyces sp. AcE210]RFC74458.1 N-acetyltransferase [Streptomyces sp. AcE210]